VIGGWFDVTRIFVAPTVLNAASYVPNTVAPGEIVAIRGYGFGPQTEILFDDFAAPIRGSLPEQINAQVPWEVTGKYFNSTNGPGSLDPSDDHTLDPSRALLAGHFLSQ
jgi:uncharacterized protein (TIGR03437 family)